MERWPEGGREARSSRRRQPPPTDGTAAHRCTSQCAHSPLAACCSTRCSLCPAPQGDPAADAPPTSPRYSQLNAVCVCVCASTHQSHCVGLSPCSPHPVCCGSPAHRSGASTSAHTTGHSSAACRTGGVCMLPYCGFSFCLRKWGSGTVVFH